jgi:hypothetical protein
MEKAPILVEDDYDEMYKGRAIYSTIQEAQRNKDHDHYSKIIREIFEEIESHELKGENSFSQTLMLQHDILISRNDRVQSKWYKELKSKYLDD